MGLKQILEHFKGLDKSYNDINEAPEEFKEIAQCILSGYFEITDSTYIVKVIPTTIEFYYHEEAGENKDYIVYHRNTKSNPNVPYFPLGLLHNHVSGIDITFESDDKSVNKYRASVLIRAFKLQKEEKKSGNIISTKDIDNHSTHLYDALYSQFNIFDGFTIKWENDKLKDKERITTTYRKNVAKYDDNQSKITATQADKDEMLTENKNYVQDMRLWSFSIND